MHVLSDYCTTCFFSSFAIMYKHSYDLRPRVLCDCRCECASHVCTGTWVSSQCWLTAELSWSESTRPSDRENRGIKHYHQKRLHCSLLWPHSFLQSSCWFVCSFVVSVWMVHLFESMHFSAPIIRWGKRRAEDEQKKGWDENIKVRTSPIFHLLKEAVISPILINIFIHLNVREFIKSVSH